MRIDLFLHHFQMPEVLAALNRLEQIMTQFGEKLDRLEADVAKQDTVEDSLVTLVTGLVEQIRSLKADLAAAGVPADQLARLDALASHVEQRVDTLTAAVTANTDTPPAPADTTGSEPTREPTN